MSHFKLAFFNKFFNIQLNCQEPRSLYDNSNIEFNTSWPINSNSKNYHHFFPKKMAGLNKPKYLVDNIANIILLDTTTNQVVVGNRAPSDYISEFARTNATLQDTLNRHLIYDIEDYKILQDDFDCFEAKRAAAFILALSKKLILHSKDVISCEISNSNN